MRAALFSFACLVSACYAKKVQEADAHFFADQLKATLEDPEVMEQVGQVAEQLRTTMQDPIVQEQANMFAQQLQASIEDSEAQEKARLFAESLRDVTMEDPRLQEKAKSLAQELKTLRSDGANEQNILAAAEQMQALLADPKIQEQAQLLTEELVLSQSQSPKAALAELLIRTPASGFTMSRPAGALKARALAKKTAPISMSEQPKREQGPPAAEWRPAENAGTDLMVKMLPAIIAMSNVAPVLAKKAAGGPTVDMNAAWVPAIMTPFITLVIPAFGFLTFFKLVEKEFD
jgi:hypothetical protein